MVEGALSRRLKHSSNMEVITQLSLLREPKELGVQLVSHARAIV